MEVTTDLELVPQVRGVTLRIHPQHLFVRHGELVHQDGRLSAQTGLQNGIVDEDVLLLQRQQVRAVSVCLFTGARHESEAAGGRM